MRTNTDENYPPKAAAISLKDQEGLHIFCAHGP